MSFFIGFFLSWIVGCACNRTRPAPMSGGSAVTDRIQRRGITRPARSRRGRTGRPLDAPEAHAKGLVLAEDGAAGPQRKGKVSADHGWPTISARDGSRL